MRSRRARISRVSADWIEGRITLSPRATVSSVPHSTSAAATFGT